MEKNKSIYLGQPLIIENIRMDSIGFATEETFDVSLIGFLSPIDVLILELKILHIIK